MILLAGHASAACNETPRPILVLCGSGCGTQQGGFCDDGGGGGTFCFNGFGSCCGNDFSTANSAGDMNCQGGGVNNPRCKLEHPHHSYHPRVFIATRCKGSLGLGEIVILPSAQIPPGYLASSHDSIQSGVGQ
jgi:hypothetical protein